MINNVFLVGRLVQDPEMRYTSNGTAVTNFTLAVERDYKNKEGEKEVDFIPVVAWNKLGEICAGNLSKGRLVAVEGAIQITKNRTEEKTYVNTEIVARNVKFLDWPKDKENKKEENIEDNN